MQQLLEADVDSIARSLLPGVPLDLILEIYGRAPGNEIASGKFASPESSAALAANAFGPFVARPGELKPPPGGEAWGWPASSVCLEATLRFPWPGGRHPCLDALIETPCGTIVVVDSYGALYHEQIRYLVSKYLKACEGTGKQVGIHTHNNQQLAFANTIEAIIQGANRIDATMFGLGRGAGNCPMELLIGFLRNPKFHLRPILRLLADHMLDLRKDVEWGPLIPYSVTGQLNQHPRAAMRILASEERHRFVDFYDACVADV